VWLPDCEKISKISLFILTQCTNATDTQTQTHPDTQTHRHTQTPHDSIGLAYASHRAAKTVGYPLFFCLTPSFLLNSEAEVTNNKRLCSIVLLKLTTDGHEALRGLSATTELPVLVLNQCFQPIKISGNICLLRSTQPSLTVRESITSKSYTVSYG